jgi:class 3 adenylate cyclase/CHASE2 domain-containing sensor protein
MGKKLKLGKPLIALLIAGLVFAVISGLHLLEVFSFLENKSYDMRIRFSADTSNKRGSDEIIVILLTQPCLDWAQKERGWGWPWPRQAYAEIVDYMKQGDAEAIAFDVLFLEPSIYRNAEQDSIIEKAINDLREIDESGYFETREVRDARGTRSSGTGAGSRQRLSLIYEDLIGLSARQDDASFARASDEYGKVVQAVFFTNKRGGVQSWPQGLETPLFYTNNFGDLLNMYDFSFSVDGQIGAQFPISELRNSAAALGSVTILPDSDGIIRRLKPFTLFDGKAVPSLAFALMTVHGEDHQIYYDDKTASIQWEDYIIPVDKEGNALLRYRGDFFNSYNNYRAMDILLSAESMRRGKNLEPGGYITDMETEWNMLSPENFSYAYVFFGFYAEGLYDIFNTPISGVYPGMGTHVTFLDNLLQRDFIEKSSEWVNILLLFLIIGLTVFLTMFSHRILVSLGGTTAIIAAIIITAFAAYQFAGLWIPMITYLFGILASFVTVTLYNYATEGSQKRFIKSAFSQYLSPKVIDQIIHDPSQLKLGGEKREMTALFTDLRAFSTFSEALGDPAKLVELLNFYLTRMCNIVLDNQGTIDKYVGDAIIGFWGAPVHMDNHAILACRSAVYMKKLERELNREALENGILTPKVLEALAAKGKLGVFDDGSPCPLYTRLGLNSGDMVVGNMGTPNKMNYTIMGNAVNLAARLEGTNDQYNTNGIIISEYTKSAIGDEFVLRPLSRVRVVGINTPLRIYELLDIASEAPPELSAMVKSWGQAFNFYENRDFLAAKNIFHTIYQKNKIDLVAKKYMERCEKFQTSPPDEKAWDNGVDNLTSK